MKLRFLSSIVLVVLALASNDANAQHGKGAGQRGPDGARKCPPGVTFNMCYEHCIKMSGTARTDMMRCSKRCSNRGCP